MRLNDLSIFSFRGIHDLHLEQLQDVNLLLGDNDAGKTSVLEAVMLCEAPGSIDMIVQNSRMRIPTPRFVGRDNYLPLETFYHLFPFDEQLKRIEIGLTVDQCQHHFSIEGELVRTLKTLDENELRRLEGYRLNKKTVQKDQTIEREVTAFHGMLEFDGMMERFFVDEGFSYHVALSSMEKNKLLSVDYVGPGDHLSGRIHSAAYRTSKRQELEIVSLLQIIDPEIEGFKLQTSEFTNGSNQMIEHKRLGDVPLYTYGDGMKKILSLASRVVNAKDGILMLDEVETSLRAANLSRVFCWLLTACQLFRVQLFVTTHSLEAISAMAQCANEHISELACYRLEKGKGRIFAKRFSEPELNLLVNGSGLDVR